MSELIAKTKKITRLGDQFLAAKGNKHFHLRAKDLLEEACLHKIFDYQELVEASFSKKIPIEQNFKFLEFSDLPITVARGDHCFIDIYFWRRRPTVIHDHHFSGAFQCLTGLNVDSEFAFTTTQKLTKYHSLGELALIREKQLHPGEVISINLLDKFIHQNHHHADLTINLCFRTSEVAKKHLSNYLYSGLKYEKDPSAMLRSHRLHAFTLMENFNLRNVDITLSDALYFLIETHGSQSQHPRLLDLHKHLYQKVKKELRVDLHGLLEKHEQKLHQIQMDYE